MKTSGRIYVLLPVHNRRAVTEGFVRRLTEQSDSGYHLVLIDDGSLDGTAEGVRALLPEVTVVKGTGSWWWAGSLQEGFEWLRHQPDGEGDIVLIANDDTYFDRDFLANGREALSTYPHSLVVAALHDRASGALLDAGANVDWRHLRFIPVRDGASVMCLSTRGLFFRRTELPELGGFHRRILPHYLSDYEFTIRARRRGFALICDPGLRIEIDEAPTSRQPIHATSFAQYLRKALSPRSSMNPLYWSSFILLASPRRYAPINLVRVWRWFLGDLWRASRFDARSSGGACE